jgi:hypothetical protein
LSDHTIRRATVADAAVIARQRTAMFLDMGEQATALESVEAAARERLAMQLETGEYSCISRKAADPCTRS